MTETVFHENEVKTNRIAGKILLGFGCVLLGFAVCGIFGIVDMGAEWCSHLLCLCAASILVFAVIINRAKYDDPHIKSLVLATVLITSGISYFMYTLGSVFLFFGPILMGVMYNDSKFILRVTVASWVVFVMTLIANMVMDAKFEFMREFHQMMGITMWSSPMYVVLYLLIPRTLIFLIAGFAAIKITNNGKKLIVRQIEVSTKASEANAELKTAARIQKISMPGSTFTSPDGNIGLSAYLQPAKYVGGDFFDHFMISDNLLVMMVGDVSDKGLPSAMFAIRAQSILRFALCSDASRNTTMGVAHVDLEKAVNLVNEQLTLNNKDNFFVTLWLCCVDCRTGIGKYINAGHLPPVIRHMGGGTEILDSEPQIFLGFSDLSSLHTGVFALRTGDSIVIYTDGVTDAVSPDGRMFGFDALRRTIEDAPADPDVSGSITNSVVNAVLGHTGSADRFDDITMLTATFSGKTNADEKRFSTQSDVSGIAKITETVNAMLARVNCPEDVRRNMDTVIDDVCTNIADYAYVGNDGTIGVSVRCDANYVTVEFRDSGPEFNPLSVDGPDTDAEPLMGGLGIFLIRSLTDSVEYRRENDENVLTVTVIWNM